MDKDAIRRLSKIYAHTEDFKPYISSIVFPKYKNLAEGQELTLDYPLTLLIGKNGTNKSSILHALYGCPYGKSTGDYWFETHVDPISVRSAYFYRYTLPGLQQNYEVEVVKQRFRRKINKDSRYYDKDYWEPSEPVQKYNMRPFPDLKCLDEEIRGFASSDRWNAIKKQVVYLDFRSELSAFDKAFNQSSLEEGARATKRLALKMKSSSLLKAIKQWKGKYLVRGKNKVKSIYRFKKHEIEQVNRILGSNYKEIKHITHSFYLPNSFSIIIQNGDTRNYSDAFAGSGETSVIRLVYGLEHAKPGSLVLLDEPETSLHIEAQYHLRDYILEKISQKHLQVVISTHSPFFAKGLPDNAIKVLRVNPAFEGKVTIMNEAPATEGSFYLGYRKAPQDKIRVYSEDKLAREVIHRACKQCLTDAEYDSIDIVDDHGDGVGYMIGLASYESNNTNSRSYYLFDGDQRPEAPIPKGDDIPDNKIQEFTEKFFGGHPTFHSGSNNKGREIQLRKSLFDHAHSRFKYLPFDTPEDFIVSANSDIFEKHQGSSKEKIKEYTIAETGTEISSADIFSTQKRLLHNLLETAAAKSVYGKIATTVKEMLRHDRESAN